MTPRWLTRTIALQVPVTVAGETIEEVEIHTTPRASMLRKIGEVGPCPGERYTVGQTMDALAVLAPDAPDGWVDQLHPADLAACFQLAHEVLGGDWGSMGRVAH